MRTRHHLVEAILIDRLQRVIQSVGIERAQGVLAVGGGKHYHGQRARLQLVRESETVDIRHLNVEEYQLGLQGFDGLPGLGRVAAFAHDGNVRVRRQCLAQREARQHLVIDQQRPNRRGLHYAHCAVAA